MQPLVRTALLAIAASAISCSIPTQEGEVGTLPDEKSFVDNKVSDFMERRCAGLDCHGHEGRPLRLYSDWGLRQVAKSDGQRQTSGTTKNEKIANYRSVVALEPEDLSRCFESEGEEFTTLQLLKKPLDQGNEGVRHKGGPIFTKDDPGWECLFGWASGKPKASACTEAAKVQ